jgi:hypothetical protein
LVFSRTSDDHLASLVKQLDKFVDENKDKKVAAVVNFLGDDPEALKTAIKKFGEKNAVKNVALAVAVDNENGPKALNISPEADLTVMFYNKKKVTANHAVKKGGLNKDAVGKIVADGKSILEESKE